MGLRFRKSVKVAPGVKLNLNKKSVGITLGTKGAHYTINSKGKRTASVGLPGTGLSYTTTSGGKKKGAVEKKPSKKAAVNKGIGILIAVIAILAAAGAIKSTLDKRAADQASSTPAVTAAATANAVDSVSSGQATDAAAAKVWVSGSGSKYHSKSDCSGMKNPEEITLQEALDLGKEPCKRCLP